MRITNIQSSFSNNYHTLSADILFEGEKKQCIFFRIDSADSEMIYNDASPFLAALLLPSMKKGEDIYVDGTISEQLYKNLKNIMNLTAKWNAGFQKVKISVKQIKKDNFIPKYNGCFFTGGVDSFYTYLKHKRSITHFITIHGCDISLKDKQFFQEVKKSINKIAVEENKKLIVIESNYREIIEPHLEWEWELGSALSAAGLFLRKGFKEIYIPGGMRYDQLCPYGTHPDLDPLYSTETLTFFHDGCEYNRLEKVLYSISKSPLALKYLRVCCFILKDTYNCNSCFKCLQTKIELYCAGVLDKSETLDNSMDLGQIRNIYYNCKLNFHLFGEDTLHYLKKNKLHTDLQKALEYSLLNSKNPYFIRRLADFIAELDKKYNKRRIYSFIFTKNNDQDRSFFFKTCARMGLIK